MCLLWLADLLMKPAFLISVSCLLCVSLMRFLLCGLESSTARPLLHCRTSSLSKALLDNVPLMNEPYRFPRWCDTSSRWSGLLPSSALCVATGVKNLLKDAAAIALNELCVSPLTQHAYLLREFLQLDDGGLVSLDWVVSSQLGCCNAEGDGLDVVIAVIVPGRWVCDSPSSLMPLCVSLMRTSQAQSSVTRPVIFNQRGCRGTPLSTPQLNSIGDTSDLRQVFQYLQTQHPRATLVVIGCSTGASLVVSYLGEFGHSALVKAGVAICPVWDLQHSIQQLNWPLRTWWSWKVKRWYLSLSAPWKCCRQPVDVLLSHQLDQMEEKLFIPFSRHANLTEYWQGNSPIRDVDDIAVPLLVVHYQDDPLVPSSTIPSELFSLYPHLLLLTFPVGGHCGLLQRLHMAATVAEEVAAHFICQMLVLIDPPALQTATNQQRKHADRNRSRRRVESLTLLRRSRNPFTAFQIRSSC